MISCPVSRSVKASMVTDRLGLSMRVPQGYGWGLMGYIGLCFNAFDQGFRQAHIRRSILLLEEFIPLELYQAVVPEVWAVDPVGGEYLFRTRFQGHECLVERSGARPNHHVRSHSSRGRRHCLSARSPAPRLAATARAASVSPVGTRGFMAGIKSKDLTADGAGDKVIHHACEQTG
jgi:hypothetical protein